MTLRLVSWKPEAKVPPVHMPMESVAAVLGINQQPQPQQQTGPRKYVGDVASGYNQKRENSSKWRSENEIIAKWLHEMPKGTKVLDCPCGTGRFIPLYRDLGFKALGVDLSPEMLNQAHKLAMETMSDEEFESKNNNIVVGQGNILDLDISDDAFDVGMMIRLTRWLTEQETVQALRNMMRMCSQKVIFTARVANHPHARSYELINTALDSRWKITRDEAIDNDPNNRMIMLEPG